MDTDTLLTLARYGCMDGPIEISSSRLAEDIGTSQQTASRRIKDMEAAGYIQREVTGRGQRIRLTTMGAGTLMNMYASLRSVFEGTEVHELSVTGEVATGMGEGRYYMQLQGYVTQFEDKLGFTPFPGTLNLKLKSKDDIMVRQTLQNSEGIKLKGFTEGDRTFGPVRAFKARINGIDSGVIIPKRTHHGIDTMEVVAPVRIRDKMDLTDGSAVSIKIIV
jgi:riboflavin kinase